MNTAKIYLKAPLASFNLPILTFNKDNIPNEPFQEIFVCVKPIAELSITF